MEQAKSPLNVVLADDHRVVRHGLRSLLESALRCSVMGEASDGREAVALVERLRPDVLVVDMVMPGLTGPEVIRQVHALAPGTRIVVLSMHADESHVREALRAVREAAAGRRYLSPPLSERAIEAYISQVGASPLDLHDTLTRRGSANWARPPGAGSVAGRNTPGTPRATGGSSPAAAPGRTARTAPSYSVFQSDVAVP